MLDAVNNSRKQQKRGRPFKPGVSGNARGRPKGARNKRTRALIEAAKAGGEAPLDYLLRVMRDPSVSPKRRDEMARAAAPYVHPKLLPVEQPAPQDKPATTSLQIVFVDPKRQLDETD